MATYFVGQGRAIAQDNYRKNETSTLWEIRGSIRESDTYKPISKANIEVNWGAYARTNQDGSFLIRARKGDELVIRHKDFETIYYTITSDDRITVEVKPSTDDSFDKDLEFRQEVQSFNTLIDSVAFYKKKDVEKSIKFVGRALLQSNSKKQNADRKSVV